MEPHAGRKRTQPTPGRDFPACWVEHGVGTMAVDSTKPAGAAHDHGSTGTADRPKGTARKRSERAGERTPPRDVASAGEANVGARPARGGSSGVGQARDGAHAGRERSGAGATHGAHRADGAHAAGGAHGHADDVVPAGTPNLKRGSSGPIVPEGAAPTLEIPDGPGFGGVEGRKQNAGDKEQNNYSVTDANFNPSWGLMERDPDTGEEMTYVKHIQSYNAAGYVDTFAKETAAKLARAQSEGAGMFLEGASYLMGLTRTRPEFLDQYGITGRDIPARIPGTDRDAREYVKDPEDATGQQWARMHHPGSAWDMYDGLVGIGLDGEQALRLAGDDGVSGAGRLNGQNNQDGGNGFNAGEAEVWKQAAQLQQRTGLPVIRTMMAGHDHNHLHPSALTEPAVNERLGITGRDASPQRAQAIYAGLLAGQLDEGSGNKDGGGGGGGAKGAGGGAGDTGAVGGAAGADDAGARDVAAGTGPAADLLAAGVAEPTLQQLLEEALLALQQSSPEVYQLLMAMAEQGIVDPAIAAAEIFGLFDDPAYTAMVDPVALQSARAALAGQGIGRAGVDPRIPSLDAAVAGGAGAPAAAVAPGGATGALDGAAAGLDALGAAAAAAGPAAPAAMAVGAGDGHAHAH